MAGIGFELRKILSRDSYTATLRAYLYAGLISSGPWVLSIVSVMLIGVLSLGVVVPDVLVRQFLITVTYLMALSLIFTGGTATVLHPLHFRSPVRAQARGDPAQPGGRAVAGDVGGGPALGDIAGDPVR